MIVSPKQIDEALAKALTNFAKEQGFEFVYSRLDAGAVIEDQPQKEYLYMTFVRNLTS